MRILSYRKLRRLFSFASMGIARSSGHGVRRRNAFKQRRDALNRHQLGNEPLEPRLLLATNITAGNRAPDLLLTSDSGFSQTDNYTNDTTPTFEFNAGGLTFGNTPAASGPETLELLINGTSRGFTMTGGANSFNGGGQANRELTLNNPLADGTYTATFRLRDNQGTPATSTSPGLTFTIDTTINPVSSRLVSGGNQSTGVHTPTDDIVITLTFDEEVEFGGGNTQSGGDPNTFINLNVGTPFSATDPVNPEVTGGRASGGLVTDQEYRFTVTANPGTSTDADGVFIDSVIGTFYDRAGNSVTDPTLGSYRGFKTGTLTFTNPVTSSTLVGVLDNSQISYPVSGITLLLNAPVPGPPVTPVGVAVGIGDFQLTRDGQVININAASITSPIIGANAFSEFLLGDLEQFTNEPGRYRLVFADASIGPIATLEWVKSVPTAGELVASLTPFPTDTTPTTPRNIPVEGIALEFLDNAGNLTPVTGVDTTAVGTAITQFEIYKDGVLQPFLTTPALGAVNISGSGSNYSINGLASFTNSDGYYQVFLSDSSAIETLDGTQLITTYSTSWEFTSKVTISSVTPPLSSTYKNNEVLSFDVNFSDFVNIDPASPPTLTIDIGGQLRTAAYAAGDGTQTLTFNYTVGSVPGSDDIDLDGIELRSPLAGTVTDLWGTDVDPRLTPPSMASVFVLSTTPTIPPTIDSIESGSTQPRITGTAQLSDGDTLSVVVAGISNTYHGSTYTVVPVNNTWTLDMSAVNPDNVSTTGDIPANTALNDDVITNISTAGLVAGMVVSHPDIPPGTTIVTKSATTITLDNSATGAGTVGAALTFSATPQEATLAGNSNYSVTAIITDAAGNTIDETDVFNTGTTAPTIETLLTSSDVPTIRGSAVLQPGESLSITVNGATYGNVTTSNVTTDGDIDNGSIEIDNIDTSDLVVGMVVNHPSHFPAGTIITAIDPTGGSTSNGKITVDQAATLGPTPGASITFENLWSLDLGTVLPSTGTLGAFVDGVAVDVVATVFGSIGYSITDTTTGELTVDRTLTPVAPGLAILPDAADGVTSTEAAAGVVSVSGVLGNTITVTFTGQLAVVDVAVPATGGLAQVVTLTGPQLGILGEGAVQVSAVQEDPAGNVSPSTSATPPPPPTPTTEFDVDIEVGAGLPSTFNAIAEAATNIWSQVIVGDLSDQVHPTTGDAIDELYIEFQAGLLGPSPSDGTNGTLANAGPRNFRGAGDANPNLPYRGEVGIDMADINNPDLLDIVVHEIGHVLGFPASTPFQNLITPAGFTGSNAVAEFVALGIDPLATAVPLDANDAHWAESVLGNEVMSQYAGPQYYLSRVTIGAFEDIGYEVNYAGADTYALFIANAESAFSIDTTAPNNATITLTPGVSDPIGTATATDSAGFISVEGEAGAEIIVTFTDGSANVVPKTIIGSGAAQQISLSAADLLLLDDGSVTVAVSQTDAAGNPQAGAAASVSITLDTDVPLAPVLALGVGVGDGATAGEATQVGGVVTVNGEASSSIEVTFTGSNGSVIKTIAGTGSAAAVILNTNDLGNIGGGTVTVSAIQTDAAGNTQTEPASSIIFELTIPIAPTVDALITNTVPPTITGTTGTSQALNAGEVLTVTINNATYTIIPDGSGVWSLDLNTVAPTSGSLNAFTDGNYPVTATVTDALGHSATDGTTNEITIDTTAPSAPTVDALTTNIGLPMITGTATLAVDEVLTVVVSGATYTVIPAGDNTWSVDLSAAVPTSGTLSPSPLTEDTYSVTATVTDNAGNTVNDVTTEELIVDTTAPTATPLLALGAGVAGGANLAEATQASGVVTIVSEDDSTIEVSLTGTAGVLTRTLTGSTSPQAIVLTAADVIVLGEGVVTVSATETDAAGNEAAAPVTIQFTVDSIVLAPTLELDASIADGASSAEAQADLLDVTGETGADVEITFTSAAATITKILTATGTSADSVVLTAVEISQLGDGRIDVSAIQTDTAGNTSPASTTFFNLDATDPTITDVAVDAGIFRTGQTINFFVTFSENVEVDTTSGTPTLDFVNGSTTLNATFASGSGTNQLRFTYTLDGTEANDTDGIELSGFTLNAGTIEDVAGNAATLALPVSTVGTATTFIMTSPVTASLSIQPNSVNATTGSPTATNPRATPTSYIKINFTGAVPFVPGLIGQGFLDLTDFELTRDGVVIANGTTGAQWPGATELIQSVNDPTEFLISDLAAITEETGTYILTFSDVTLADEQDLSWVKTVATPPQLTAFITLDPSSASAPRQTAVDSATITFNQSVIGLDLDDFELVYTDNTGAQTTYGATAPATAWSTTQVTLSIDGAGAQATLLGLSTLGGAEGSYELRLIQDFSVTGIQGLAGAQLITAVSAEWDVDQIATISSITLPSVPSSGLYKSGEVLAFDAVFNELVQVNGIPELPLTIGASTVNATYVGGTGTTTLTFEYTIQNGDLDTDGIGFNGTSLVLPAGSTIQDAAALNASLLFSAPNNSGAVLPTPKTIADIRIDAVKPTIVSVSGPPSGRYDATAPNNVLEFKVSFDEEVTLTYSVTPNIVVTIGTETFTADLDPAHATGSSGTSFTFKIDLSTPLYANAVSVTGVSVDSLNLGAGSTLVDTAGNEANTTLTPASFPGVVVNQAEATVAVSATDETGGAKALPATLAETDILIFTATFSDDVTVTGAPSINMQLGTSAVNAVYSSGSGGNILEFRYSVQAGDLDLDGIQLPSLAIALNGGTIVDSKNNAASLIFPAPATPAASDVKVDAVDPLTPTVDALIDYTGSPTITGTVTLGSNETLDVTVNGTTYSSTGDVTVVGNDWSLDLSAVTPSVTLTDDTYEVTATVTDAAGNAASDTTTNELVVDAVRTDDVASVTSATPDGSYGIGQVITIDVQMERAVTVNTTLGSPTLTLDTTPVRNAAFAGAVGNTLSFTYTVQDGDTAADLDVSALNLNGAVIEDASGNQPSVSSIATLLSGAHDIVIDTTAPVAPTVTVPQTTNSTAPTITGTSGTGAALNTGEILSVVVNGATYEVTPDGSGDWSLDLATTSPASGTLGAFVDGTYAVTATVTDAAGNAASDTTTNELVVDTTAPAAPTVDALITDLEDPTVSAPTITGTAVLGEGETLTVTVDGTTYSSTTGDVTVVGNDWSLDLSPLLPPPGTLADDTYEVTATVTDAAGNIVNDATTEELVIDTADPEIEFVTTPTADGTYGIGAVINIDIQLSEAVIVNTALGSPTLTLNTTPTRHAEFTGAVGNILSFTYTSQDGDTAANLDVDALNLNGAVIEDAAGNQADDSNLGNTVTLDAAIVINAVIPSATVTVTGLGDNYTYDVDQVIELTADFGAAVDVVGTPTISLLVGDNVVDATYATGSGTSEIKFRYEVQQADLDEDGIEIPTAAIELAANTTITDVELGNDVQLTFTPPDTQNVNVNSLPRVTEIEAAKDGTPITDGSYDTGDVITLTLTTSIPVKVSNPESTKLYLNTDGSNVTDYAIFVGDSSTFTNKLEFQYTVADGDNSEDLDYISTTALEFVQGTITSGAGINLSPNLQVPGTENSLSYGNELIINTRAPQIESFSTINPDGRYSIGQNIVIRATLSEEVAADQTFKLVLDTGVGRTVEMTTDGSIRASGIYTIQPGDSSESLKVLDILPESLTDDAGNSLLTTLPSSITVGNIIVDTTAPTVINFNVTEIDGSAASAYESGIYGVGTALKIEATTDESVRAGSTIEATLNNGDVVRLAAATAGTTLSGIYTVGSDPSSTNPDLSVDSFTPIVMRDVAGNSIDTPTAIPAFPNNIGDVHDLEIDTTPPNVVEFTADDGMYKAGDNIAITATLSEEINGTHDLKVELSSGGFANLAIADGANVAIGNYTVQPGDTTSDLTVAKIYAGSIVDFANNQLFTALPSGTNLGDTANIVLDTTAPTVESLVSDLTTINSTQSATIDITLNEDSTDFSIFDLNTTSGRFDPLSFSGSGSNYTVGFIPDANFEGDAVISVENGSFNDTVGNAFNSTTPTLTIAVDSKAPTVGISADNTSLLAGDTSILTLTLSEEAANATDFGFADLAVSNGTLDINTFTPVTATEYTVVYTPEQDFEGTVTFNVAGSTFSDTFLNPNEASTDLNITVDTKVPTATLTSDLASLNATQNATINISLSEASSFAETGDVPSANATTEINSVDTTDLAVGMAVSGGDVPVGATIASIDSATQLTLSAPVATGTGTLGEALTFTENEAGDVPSATLTSLITDIDTTNLAVGMTVSGGDVPVGATIISMAFGTQLTLNTPVTTGTGTTGEALTFTESEAGDVPSATLTVELTNVDTTDLVVGMTVSGGDIPAGATIASIDSATQLTLSAPVVTGIGTTGESLSFTTTKTGDLPDEISPFPNVISNINASDLQIGMLVSGDFIPVGTQIVSIEPTFTEITVSQDVDVPLGAPGVSLTFTAVETGDVPSANAVNELTSVDTTDLAPGMTVSGGDVPVGAMIVSIDSATQLTLSAPVTTGTGTVGETLTFTTDQTGDVPSASLTREITSVDTTDLAVGMTVSGGDIPGGATIATIDSATQLTLSAPVVAGSGTTGEALTFTTSETGDVPSANAGSEISNIDTTSLTVGMTISGGDIPGGATIASIDSATQLTLSAPVTTGTGTPGESLAFGLEEFEFGDLTVTNGTLDPATFTAINSTEYSVVFIPDAATTGDAVISIPADSFKDLSGNNNSVDSNLTIAVDTIAPTVVDVTPVLSTLNASQNTVVNINLSEDSADFTVADLTPTNGTFENGSFNGSGSNYSVVFIPDADVEDTALVSVENGSFTDLAGNPLNSTAPNATLTLDTKVPTVDITPDDAALSIGENTTLTLTLSDAPGNVSDFTFENLSASSGSLDPSTFTNIDATTYKVDYTPDADFEGNVTVLAAAGQFTDTALNPNAEGNLTLAVDTKAPVATITSDINPVNGVQNATISISLSEDSSDFDFSDLSATTGTLNASTFTGSNSSYTVVFEPDSTTTGDAVISIAADSFADGSGNNNSVESNLTIAVDTVAPTVLDITPVLSSLNATQNTSISINLSEDSADFTVDDLTVTNGEFENGSFTGSGSNYSVVFVPFADVEDTAVISVENGSFTDLAGNPLNSTAPNATLTLDTKAPAAPALTLEAGFPVTDPVGLDEATQDPNGVVSVQGEVGANISVSFTGTGGSVQKTIMGDGTTQGVVLDSTEAASLGQGPVSVVATQTDAANNPQTDPASTLSFELDTIAPNAATVAFAAGVTDAVSDAESSAPVTVNGEVDAALTVTFTGDDGVVTQNLTGTGIDQNVNLNAAQLLQIDSDGVGPVEVSVTQSDLAGNNQTASAETLTFTLDTVAPSAPGLTLAGSDPLSADEAATPVTISAEANASVTVVFEGVSGNVTQNITGTGSSQNVTLNTAQLATLGDGLVSVSASQIDQAGNPQSGAANTSAFTLDTIAPAAPQLALGNGIVGTVSSDEATRAAGVVTVQGEVASTITVTFLGTSGLTVPKSITGDGTAQGVVLTLTDLATLGDGPVSVSATQADEAGNQQTLPATSMSFNLDATAPAAAGLSLNVPTGDLPVGINEVTQPSGIVVVSGELDAEITITFAGQANTIVKPVSGTNTPQPITLTLSEADFLGQGTVTVTVSQTDDAGNLQDAAAASVAFDLDTIAPVAPVVSLENSIIPAVSFDEATQDPAGVVTVVGEAGATVVVTLTGSADQIDKTITSTGTDGVVLTNADLIILGEGTVNVSAIQTDPSGNVSPVGTTSFVLDSIAPVAPAIALTSTLDNPVSEAEALSSSGVVTVTGEVNAAIAVTFTGQSGTLTRNLTGVGAPQAVILSSGDLTTLGDGSVSVTAVQTDEAGNDSPTGSLPSFVLDTVAPAAPVVALNVSVTDPITASEATQATGIATVTGENGSTIAVTLVGSNNLPVVKQIAGNGSTLMPVVLNGSDLIILGEGIVNVTAIQTDEAGNQQTVGGASLSFVLDTVNPEVSHFNATTPSGNYKAGETINLVATLSEVTASGTEFTAVLNTGATVIFTASSTGTVLEGSYTIGGSHNANPLAVTSILPGTVLDEAGNSLATTVPTSNTFNGIAVDTTSPQPAAIVLLSSDPVSGSEATAPGGFATVTAEPGATVVVTINGPNGTSTGGPITQNLLGTGSAQPIKLTVAELPTLGDGLVTLTAVQTDAAGNRQILPDQAITFTLDTVIPATPTMELGAGVSDGATAAEATQAAGVVRVTGEAGASISVTLTGTVGTVTPTPIVANGVSQAIRLTSGDLIALGEGLVIVSAVQTDAAGNTQPIAAELTFQLDTVAPAAPLVNLANGVTNPISLAEATQVAAAGGLISVRGEAGAELIITFSGALGGVTRTLTATGFNQPIELSPTEVTSLGDGLLDVTARQVDPAGNNSSETPPMNLTLDTVDPTIYSRLLDAPAGFYNAGDQIPIVITLSEPSVPGQQLSVVLNVLDQGGNPVRVFATVGTGADAVKAFGTYTVAPGQNTTDLAIDSVLNDMTNNFVTDIAGNKLIDDNAQQSSNISSLVSGSSSSVSSGIVIDTSAPEILGISTPSTQTVYNEGDTVTIVVGLSEPVVAGSKIEVTVNSRPETQPSLVLEALADGTTMIGHYTVGLAEVADQLSISSTSANILDLAGNQFVHSSSNSLVSSLLSGIQIDGSITVADNGANWGPQPEEGYRSVTIDLTADVTGVTLDAFTVTHNGRTISLRDASLQQTTSANYVLRLPNRVANLTGGFTITIFSTDIRTITHNYEDMDSPIVIVMPDPGMNTDPTNGRSTGD